MYSLEKHLDNLTRHITLVRESCLILGKKFIEEGRIEFGRILIARGFCHDVSKFYGIEWEYLHAGPDTPKEKLDMAVKQHVTTNDHHPEYYGGIDYMPDIAIAEMVADWSARSQEFGTSLKEWIVNTAIQKYSIDTEGKKYRFITKCVNMLYENSFVK